MKRVFALVLTLATALGLAACNSGGGESGENVVRIGIFEPATGDNGAGGKQEMLGMQYANKETPTVISAAPPIPWSWSMRTTAPTPPRRPLPLRSW